MISKILEILKNKNIAILGFGKEGVSTYEFLRKYLPFQKITIIDAKDVSDNPILQNDDNISYVSGENYLEGLEKYDLVIKSPGISLKDINHQNINITSQIELLLKVCRDQVIGVTGTKGKTTTSSLIYSIIKASGKDVIIAGNIGTPVFSILDTIKKDTLIVIEMSSHQLEFLDVSPHIGIVLNLFADHLDHAGTLEHYHNIKMQMFAHQTVNDYMIYCQDNPALDALVKKNDFQAQKVTIDMQKNADVWINDEMICYKNKPLFSKEIDTNLKGKHNLENIMVAIAVSKILSLDNDVILQAIKEFKPVKYRLEKIGIVNDIIYYVDTLATIPEATENALEALGNVNTLIFGGLDRGISYDDFIAYLNASSVKHFICMPTTGHKIAKSLPQDKVYIVNDLKEACLLAKKITKKNSICLLSPAAASYDYFKNYAEKGEKFKEYILN